MIATQMTIANTVHDNPNTALIRSEVSWSVSSSVITHASLNDMYHVMLPTNAAINICIALSFLAKQSMTQKQGPRLRAGQSRAKERHGKTETLACSHYGWVACVFYLMVCIALLAYVCRLNLDVHPLLPFR